MVSIIIYTKPETLLHKQGNLENDPDHSDFNEYYWSFDKTPKNIKEGDKIYFATKGFIRGYFEILEVDYDEITWDSRTWCALKKSIPTKHFQGFKYADKVEGLK